MFLLFNRPDQTQRVFEAIRQAKPKQLFVAADGPRPGREGEAEKCARARQVIENVDWDCEVKTLFRNRNLGCKIAVSSAIDWFFGQVEEGIILEDDTLPNQSFFGFCTQLLQHYRNNPKVMHISGNNFQEGARRGDGSYYFSIYNHIWGWATWRRAWKQYDREMKALDGFLKADKINRFTRQSREQHHWIDSFTKVRDGLIDTWDYQWTFTIWSRGGVSVLPNVNLVTNIGFGSDATHTLAADSPLANLPVHPVGPIVHPLRIEVDRAADAFSRRNIFLLEDPVASPSTFARLKKYIYRVHNLLNKIR